MRFARLLMLPWLMLALPDVLNAQSLLPSSTGRSSVAVELPGPKTELLPGRAAEFVVPDRINWESSSTASTGGFRISADLLVLVPRFESNPGLTITTRTVNPAGLPLAIQNVQEFDYNFAVSPRVWVGYEVANGLGVRARWFGYDQRAPTIEATNNPIPLGSTTTSRSIASTSPLMAIAPPTSLFGVNSLQAPAPFGLPERVQVFNDMRLNVWDVEATFSDLQIGTWTLELFGGVRYAQLIQHYDATVSGGFISQFLVSGQSFNGVGPTFGLEGRRALPIPGLSFVGAGRISMLFGEDKHTVSGQGLGVFPPFVLSAAANSSSRRRMLPVFDMELGFEWKRVFGGVEAVTQAGVLAQGWPAGSGANGNGNMGFFGLNFGAGIRY